MVGVKIGDFHTWNDWKLYLNEIIITQPDQLEERVSVPVKNGKLDTGMYKSDFSKFEDRLMKLEFEMESASDAHMIQKMSEIAGKIHGKETIVILDDESDKFYKGRCEIDYFRKNPMIVAVTISIVIDPFKYSSEILETVGTLESKNVVIKGDYETPCIIELIPTGSIITYTIQGIARDPITGEPEDIVVKNLKQGKKVIIDGENCTVTEDGRNKFAETEMWEFPSLLPGSNIVTFVSSSVPCEVTIKYKPRYI